MIKIIKYHRICNHFKSNLKTHFKNMRNTKNQYTHSNINIIAQAK